MLSIHYEGSNSFLFPNEVKMYQFKGKNSEIKPYPLCLDNISKCFKLNNMEKNSIKRTLTVFSVDYNLINTTDLLDIHIYLLRKGLCKLMFRIV